MIKYFRKLELKFLRRLFLWENPLFSTYLTVRNFFASKKVFLSELKSTETLKFTDFFHKRFNEETFHFNLNRVNPKLIDFDMKVPAIGYYKLENIIVNPASHLFYYNNIWYHQEIASNNCARWAAAGKHFLESTTNHILSYKLKEEFIEKGIFIGGHFSVNWYHWVLEIISRIAMINGANLDLKGYVLCIPKVNEDLKNHMDIFKLLNLNIPIKYLDVDTFYNIKDAFTIDAPLFGRPHWKRKPECNKQLPFFVNHLALKEYQRIIISSSGITHSDKGKKIFLGRKRQNRIYNQDEVFEFFSGHGFEMVYCEELSVKEQIVLFSQVEMIVGPTGASWTNLFFCKPGCKGFCWAPEFEDAYPLFALLGLGFGIDIRYDYFKVGKSDWRTWKADGSYSLTNEFLERNIKFLTQP